MARSYKLPFLAVFDSPTSAIRSELTPTDIVPDVTIMRLQKGTPEEWRKYYLDAIRTLKPGLTMMLVHLAPDQASSHSLLEKTAGALAGRAP